MSTSRWRSQRTIRPSTVINAPGAGYIVPAQQARLVRTILSLHGIQSEGLRDGMAKADVRTFRAAEAKPATGSMEGHQRMTFTGAWQDEQRSIPAGSVFVPIAQPEARLVMAILEPMLSDSLAAWGEFNNAFEGKEYMEPYVAEEVAREMLRNDPKLQSEFAHALEDPAFAADPFARLNFFYKRHASFDERLNLYPVYRVDRWPQ